MMGTGIHHVVVHWSTLVRDRSRAKDPFGEDNLWLNARQAMTDLRSRSVKIHLIMPYHLEESGAEGERTDAQDFDNLLVALGVDEHIQRRVMFTDSFMRGTGSASVLPKSVNQFIAVAAKAEEPVWIIEPQDSRSRPSSYLSEASQSHARVIVLNKGEDLVERYQEVFKDIPLKTAVPDSRDVEELCVVEYEPPERHSAIVSGKSNSDSGKSSDGHSTASSVQGERDEDYEVRLQAYTEQLIATIDERCRQYDNRYAVLESPVGPYFLSVRAAHPKTGEIQEWSVAYRKDTGCWAIASEIRPGRWILEGDPKFNINTGVHLLFGFASNEYHSHVSLNEQNEAYNKQHAADISCKRKSAKPVHSIKLMDSPMRQSLHDFMQPVIQKAFGETYQFLTRDEYMNPTRSQWLVLQGRRAASENPYEEICANNSDTEHVYTDAEERKVSGNVNHANVTLTTEGDTAMGSSQIDLPGRLNKIIALLQGIDWSKRVGFFGGVIDTVTKKKMPHGVRDVLLVLRAYQAAGPVSSTQLADALHAKIQARLTVNHWFSFFTRRSRQTNTKRLYQLMMGVSVMSQHAFDEAAGNLAKCQAVNLQATSGLVILDALPSELPPPLPPRAVKTVTKNGYTEILSQNTSGREPEDAPVSYTSRSQEVQVGEVLSEKGRPVSPVVYSVPHKDKKRKKEGGDANNSVTQTSLAFTSATLLSDKPLQIVNSQGTGTEVAITA